MDIAMFFSRLFFALSFLNYAFVFFLLFFERKDSASRFAWILTLAFLPVLGLLIYILFSGHFFTKTQRMKEAKEHVNEASTTFMENQQDFFEKQAGTFSNPILNEYSSLIDMNLNYANAPITFTDSVKIFTWGKDIFDNLFEDIKNARHYIFLQYFIIRNDQTGQKFINLLCEKAREGVEVKLLYDDLGSFKTPHSLFAQLDKAGGVSLPFFPVKTGNIWSLNFRNHRKIVVIDNKIGYTGGFNIGNEYAGLTDLTWRDTHIRLTGNCIFDLLITFLIDWHAMATGKRTKIKYKGLTERLIPDMYAINKKIFSGLTGKTTVSSKIPTQIISSGPDNQQRTEIKDAMIRMIMNAKKTIFLQTPYFTPDPSFFSAVKIAALSGIDVRIMVPGEWDKFYVKAAAFQFIRDMIPLGITFYKYPGFIHAKAIVVDGKVLTIGSCNIDCRSFELHYETNVFFYNEAFAKKYEKIFLADQSKCRQYEAQWFESRNIFQKAWWGFCRLFSPIM